MVYSKFSKSRIIKSAFSKLLPHTDTYYPLPDFDPTTNVLSILSKVENNELEFDHCLASLDMADKIKHLQKVLREKMPHTRRGK